VIIIGVDPHKRTHTASAVDAATNAVAATLQIDASLAGYRQLLRWSARFAERRWAVENARGLGRHRPDPGSAAPGRPTRQRTAHGLEKVCADELRPYLAGPPSGSAAAASTAYSSSP
jgi:hypothetical protein